MRCKRCNNTNIFLFEKLYCPNCVDCYYCVNCAHISIFKLCDELKNDLVFTYKHVDYNLKYNLTTNQKKLSNEIVKNIKYKNIFINATCGAGKTEIVFDVIKEHINNNKHVCFVSPRIEVTNELYLRFNHAFNTEFGIITGEKKKFSGAMFFMTCHQLINYHNTFDLIIVDEADAFPLANDTILEKGLVNCLKKSGKIIKMSATPLTISRKYLTLTLFERYHKQKIPVPIFKKTSISYLKELISLGKWIVFFPTIKNLEEVYQEFDKFDIVICHSKVTNISERLDSLSDTFIIFSTAILERGITISNVNVAIFNSHHDNYQRNTLIQISGRVGRVAPYTNGQIIIMGDYKTRAIANTIEYIRGLND